MTDSEALPVELIALFMDLLGERTRALRAALETTDRAAIAKLTHTIAGTAGSYGYPSLTRLARAAQQAARTRTTSLADLRGATEAVIVAAEEIVGQAP